MNSISIWSTLLMYSGLGLGYNQYNNNDSYNGQQVINVLIEDYGGAGIEESIQSIQERLYDFYPYEGEITVSADSIQVIIPGYLEVKETIALMQAKAKLEIVETIDAQDLRAALLESGGEFPHLIEAHPSDMYSNGLARTSYEGEEHLLTWAYDMEDAQFIDSLLSLPRYRAAIPPSVELHWSTDIGYSSHSMELVACKKAESHASINSKMIAGTELRYDENTYIEYVDCQLKDEYAELWNDVTERNKGKVMAVLLDGVVISDPVIMETIEDGSFSIEVGHFHYGAAMMAILLRQPELEDGVKIKSVKWVSY